MCDSEMMKKWAEGAMTRRRFGQVAAASGLAFGAAGCAIPGPTRCGLYRCRMG